MLASTSHQLSAVAHLAALSLPGRVHIGSVPEPVRRLSSGRDNVDALLSGGVPRGRISEFLGPHSAGKTALLHTLLAACTGRGEVVACVDPADALYPASLAAAGVDLSRVLWARPPSITDAIRCTELILQAGGFGLVSLDIGTAVPQSLRSHVWPRLLRAAEQSHSALIILTPQQIAGSFAVISLRLQPRSVLWRCGLWPLFDGFESAALLVRNKFGTPGRHAVLQVGSHGT